MQKPLRAALVALVVIGQLGVGPRVALAAEDTRIADAAERRDAKAVAALIKQGANAGAVQADGATALHWAAHWNDLPTAKALIAAGAKIDIANDYGVTPAFLAATNGSAAMLELLLKAGASGSATLPTGETLLMTAVQSGNLEAVRLVVASGADVNAAQRSKTQTALMWAATVGKPEIVSFLLAHGAMVNATSKSGFTPLMFAARQGRIDISRALIDAGAEVNKSATDGSTALLVATVRSHVELAMFLLDHGAAADGDAAKAGYAPLHWIGQRYEPVEATLTGAKPDLELPGEWNALAGIADRSAAARLAKALIAKGASVDAKSTKSLPSPLRFGFGGAPAGSTPLVVAASSADAPVMKVLLDAGANANVKLSGGKNLLLAMLGNGSAQTSMRISEKDRINVIQLCLEAGVDIEAADDRGYRPIHTAALAGFHQVISYLIERRADLNSLTAPKVVPKPAGTGATVGFTMPEVVAGQSALALVESPGNERPETAEFLRKLGARSIGSVAASNGVARTQP